MKSLRKISIFALLAVLLSAMSFTTVKEKPVVKPTSITVSFCHFTTPCDGNVYYSISYPPATVDRTLVIILTTNGPRPYGVRRHIFQRTVPANTSAFGASAGILSCGSTLTGYSFSFI